MLEADLGKLPHFLVGRISTEIGGDNCIVAKHFTYQRIGAAAERWGQDGAGGVDHVHVALSLVGAKLVDLLLEVGIVHGEKVSRQIQTLPAWIVSVESTLEIASNWSQPAPDVWTHTDWIEFQRGHAEVVIQLPQFGQLLHQGRNDVLRRVQVRQGVGDHESVQPGQRIERNLCDEVFVQLFDVHSPAVSQGHGWGAKTSAVGDGEIDLLFSRYGSLESHAVCLRHSIANAMFDEIEAFFLSQRGRQVGSSADHSRLALLTHAAFKHWLDEHRPVTTDECLDLVFARVRSQYLRGGIAGKLQQLRAVEHSRDLHVILLFRARAICGALG